MKKLFDYIKNNLPHTLSGKIATAILFFWIVIAILSPFLANNKPILAKNKTGWSMPIFSERSIPESEVYTFKIDPIIAYRYDQLNLESPYKPPLTRGTKGIHFLGTDQLGRDVAAGMLNGARVAMIVSFTSIAFSILVGFLIGLVMGFYGDSGIKRNLAQQFWYIILFIFLFYYVINLVSSPFSVYTLVPIPTLLIFGSFVNHFLGKLPLRRYGLPIDIVIQRIFEINESVPGLFIILAFVAIVLNPTMMTLSLIIAFLYWMTFARHARAETYQIKEEDYVKSARSSGMSDLQIMIKHILPNALPSLLVIVAFSFSGVILMESTLSFLGLGLPLEEISWGKILAEGRNSTNSWWLAVFPGLAIFLVLYSFNTLGDLAANYQRKN